MTETNPTKVWDLASGLEAVRDLQVIVNSEDSSAKDFGKYHQHPLVLELRQNNVHLTNASEAEVCTICTKVLKDSDAEVHRCISSQCKHIECLECHVRIMHETALRRKAESMYDKLLPVVRTCSALVEEIKRGLNSALFTRDDKSDNDPQFTTSPPGKCGNCGKDSKRDCSDMSGLGVHTKRKRGVSPLVQEADGGGGVARAKVTNTDGAARGGNADESTSDVPHGKGDGTASHSSSGSMGPSRTVSGTSASSAPVVKRRRRATSTKEFKKMAEQVMQFTRMSEVLRPEDIYPTGDLAALQREAEEDVAKCAAMHKPNSQLQHPNGERHGEGSDKDRIPPHERGMYDNMPLSCDELFCKFYATTAPSLATHRTQVHGSHSAGGGVAADPNSGGSKRRGGDAAARYAANPDAYEVLGVPTYATMQLIKARYHHLCRRWHPDRNSEQDTTAEFQILQEAYNHITETFSRR